MSRKSKNPSKSEVRDFFPTSKERDDVLEEYGEFFDDSDDFFDDDEDDDD